MSAIKQHLLTAVLGLALLVAGAPPALAGPGSGGGGRAGHVRAVPRAGAGRPINLNLSSTTRNLGPGKLIQTNPVLITEGGTTRVITAHSRVTAAERLAVYQVSSTGRQTIELGTGGNAVGGSFVVGPRFSSYVRSVTIPTGVTAIRDFGTGSTLSLSGNFSNSGTFYALSSNGQVATATVNARNIVNQQGALLTSVLPAAGLSGFSSVVPNLSLSLNALNNVVNMGTIATSGQLSLAAGGAIINALPAGAAGARPLIQALNNVNLQSAAVTNAGLIAATNGNINVNANPARDIVINNYGGQLQALNGAINVRDASYTGNANLSLAGGDLLSREVNLNTGMGALNVNVGNVTGILNTTAGEAHVTTAAPTLSLGNATIPGDPVIFNFGNINITMDLFVNSAPLFIVATGDITVSPGVTITIGRNIDGRGGFPITFVAGANITSPPPPCTTCPPTLNIPPIPPLPRLVTFDPNSPTGGNINFNGATVLVNSSGNRVGGVGGAVNGGNITFAAFGNTPGTGQILLGPTVTTRASGSPPGPFFDPPPGLPGLVRYIAPSTIVAGAGPALVTNSQPTTSNGRPMTIAGSGRVISGNFLTGAVTPPHPTPTGTIPIEFLPPNQPELIPILFVPPPQAFTPPIVVPTDVTYVSVEEAGGEAELALVGIYTVSNFPVAGKLKGAENGILVKYLPNSTYDRPNVYSVDLHSGTVLVSVRRPSEQALVHTDRGEVAIAANGDAVVSCVNGLLRVQNITGRGNSVKVEFSSGQGMPSPKIVAVKTGFEFVASDHRLGRAEIRPVDGIARRHSKVLENGYAAVSEFSVESLLSSSELIASLSQKSAGVGERKILGDMSKMAAVLNYVNGTQGFVAEASVGPMDQ